MRKTAFTISFFLLISLFISVNSQDKPALVVVIGRHGTCEPSLSSYDDLWKSPSYLGDVGIEQHYTLGNLLAKKYSHLLDGILPKQIYLQEIDNKCARMSLSAELLGLFHDQSHKHLPNTTKKDFNIPYENQDLVNEVTEELTASSASIPNRLQFLTQKFVATEGAPDTEVFQVDPTTCTILRRGFQMRFDSEPNRRMTHELIETIKSVKRLNYNVNDIHQLKQFGDDLLSRYNAGQPPLESVPFEDPIFENSVFALKWWNLYNLVGNGTERAVQLFPFYNSLSKWFQEVAKGKISMRFALLNGYDHSLFTLLDLYNITNAHCFYGNHYSQKQGKGLLYPDCEYPEVGSQLIYEFYNTKNPYIKMLYNGKPVKFCRYSKGIECPLEDFLKEVPEVLESLDQEKHDDLCGLPKQPKKKSKVGMIVATSILGLIVVLTIYLLLSKKVKLRTKVDNETRAILAGIRESGVKLVR